MESYGILCDYIRIAASFRSAGQLASKVARFIWQLSMPAQWNINFVFVKKKELQSHASKWGGAALKLDVRGPHRPARNQQIHTKTRAPHVMSWQQCSERSPTRWPQKLSKWRKMNQNGNTLSVDIVSSITIRERCLETSCLAFQLSKCVRRSGLSAHLQIFYECALRVSHPLTGG